MQWSRGKNAGFSTGKAEDLYLPVQEDGVNVEDQLADEHSLLNTTRKLIALRKSSHALSAEGEIEFLNRRYNGYPLIYRRSGSDGSYLICINPTDREQTFDWELAGAQILMENSAAQVSDKAIRLAPVSYAILKI
jgi:maltose alpha-D-glucosyltransferase/alpha-amylase